ncbi:MAG: hypothetical protein WAO83_09910 [Fuerstiella sp.]
MNELVDLIAFRALSPWCEYALGDVVCAKTTLLPQVESEINSPLGAGQEVRTSGV